MTFEQIKPTILASLGLEGAKEWRSGYSTEYEWKKHPNHPKVYLIWADFEEGMYIVHDIKVLDTPVSERLLYVLGRTRISKWYFEKTLDSERFRMFKEANALEETPFFQTRMEQLLSS
jgi:hypothetical protein